MTKIFLPPLDSRWRLKADWPMPKAVLDRRDNELTLWGSDWSKDWNHYDKKVEARPATQQGYGYGRSDPASDAWVNRFTAWRKQQRDERGEPEFLAGTIIQIERYHVSRSGEDQITVKVLLAPDRRLTPKKQKGLMTGPGRLYFMLHEFNSLPELEEFTDVLDR